MSAVEAGSSAPREEGTGDNVKLETRDRDFVAGALGVAFAYVDAPKVRDALSQLAESGDEETTLVKVLADEGVLSKRRSEKLERATHLMEMLRDAAVFGSIALNNKLIGEDMLNACMEENRQKGFKTKIGPFLLDKGVLTESLVDAIVSRADEVLEEIRRPARRIAETLDFERDDDELQILKVEMLLGEVAAKLSFLTRDRLEDYLQDDDAIRKGKPVGKSQAASQEISAKDPIAGYEVISKLGQGAMGAVFKAKRKQNGEVVALKVLKPDLSGDQEFVQRFLREAKAVARLNHQNIIRAIDVGKSGKFYYFAMEFVDGESASDYLDSKPTMPEKLALRVCKQVALALDHAWKHKIIHRDVKPDNIMVTKDGVAKLTDLGLARNVAQSTLTLTGVVMGSPAYISPEQATGEKNLDTRSDIYSLGASLYHMLTGHVPYSGDSPLQVMLRHMNDPLPDVRAKVPTISEGTRQLVFKMMAKRPESRFQNARQLYDAISAVEKLLAGSSIEELSKSSGVRRGAGPGLAGQPPRAAGRTGAAAVQSGTVPSGAAPAKAAGRRPGSGKTGKPAAKAPSGKAPAAGKKPAKTGKKAKRKEIGEKLKKMKKRRI